MAPLIMFVLIMAGIALALFLFFDWVRSDDVKKYTIPDDTYAPIDKAAQLKKEMFGEDDEQS